MKKKTLREKRAAAGRIGGCATRDKYGSDHFRKIGEAGAEVTWGRYYKAPYGQSQYMMVRRDNNKIIRVIGRASRMENILDGDLP